MILNTTKSEPVVLGGGWVAVPFEDGGVGIYKLDEVYIGGDGRRVSLFCSSEDYKSLKEFAGMADIERFAVRVLYLSPSGEVIIDEHAISPGGQLTSDAFCVIPSAIESAKRYFEKTSGRSDW